MPDFFVVLAFYYACDAAAAAGSLPPPKVPDCIAAYQVVKTHFLTEAEREALPDADRFLRSDTLRRGYLRFKSWERDNPGRVRGLRGQLIDVPA